MSAPEFDGTYQLVTPPDTFNVLEPGDLATITQKFSDLFSAMFPSILPEDLDKLVDGMVRWRDALLDQGIIFHGITSVPPGYEFEGHVFGEIHWHVFAGVVEVPAYSDLDAGAMMKRIFGQQLTDPLTHLESFESTMGWGAGLITTVDVLPGPLPVNAIRVPDQMAVAAVLSGAHGSTQALLTVGVSVDVEQRYQLAMLVGLIGGRSTISPNLAP